MTTRIIPNSHNEKCRVITMGEISVALSDIDSIGPKGPFLIIVQHMATLHIETTLLTTSLMLHSIKKQ